MIGNLNTQISEFQSRVNDTTISNDEKQNIHLEISQLMVKRDDYNSAIQGAEREIGIKYLGSNTPKY